MIELDVWLGNLFCHLLGVEGDCEGESIETFVLTVCNHGLPHHHPLLCGFRMVESFNVLARRLHLAFVPCVPNDDHTGGSKYFKIGHVHLHAGVHLGRLLTRHRTRSHV